MCATIIITSIDIYADEKEIDDVENTYVEHNYKTGKDKKIKIISDLVEKSNYSADERISMPYTPKRSNGDLSTMNILPNESLKKVDATAEPYCKVTYLYIGRDNNHDGIVESWAGGTGFMVHDDIMLTAGHCMYNKDNGNVEELSIDSKYTFSHTCSTRGGESGAPAYDSNNIVWGIHTSGGEKANYGCLITSALFDVIERFE